jgi:hypothetical protein
MPSSLRLAFRRPAKVVGRRWIVTKELYYGPEMGPDWLAIAPFPIAERFSQDDHPIGNFPL